jgi:hypothetical protein
MNGFEWILAVILLTTPPGKVEVTDIAPLHRWLAPALTTLAIQCQLLDAREGDYLKSTQDFASDLGLLQGRYQELRDAPPVGEVERFPTREVVNEMLTFNRNYREGLNCRLSIDAFHSEELKTIMEETDQLHRVYEAVRDARCDYYYVTYRRQALAQLRDLVGAEAFYAGRLPPNVPLWRIPEAH